MTFSFTVENTENADLPLIYELFDASIVYQLQHGYPDWRNYDKNVIARDIEHGLQYKGVHAGDIAIVFSIAYRDKVIWREKDNGDSLYLHRIVTHPAYKGQRLFQLVIDWSIKHALQKNISKIRMDTWAANENLIQYYKSFGFQVVEHYLTPDSEELPIHNRKLALTLLEYKS